MKTVGIIGGLSPESTMEYYKGLNDGVKARLGGHHSARIMLASLDFGEFVALKEAGDWDTQALLLAEAAQSLERAGADFVILSTNTMHKMAAQIEAALTVPFLHLADATAGRIAAQGLDTVGLLGTRYTMELDFYKGRLADQGIKVLVPDEDGRKIVHDVIYDELCHNKVLDGSRQAYRAVMADLAAQGAQGIILGCTEITMLVGDSDATVPLFDTTRIHVQAALEEIFAGD